MLIGKKWKIESDSMNVILFKKAKSKKPGTVTWATVGFYATVPNALKALVNHGVKETELTDLMTISAKLEELHRLIEEVTE